MILHAVSCQVVGWIFLTIWPNTAIWLYLVYNLYQFLFVFSVAGALVVFGGTGSLWRGVFSSSSVTNDWTTVLACIQLWYHYWKIFLHLAHSYYYYPNTVKPSPPHSPGNFTFQIKIVSVNSANNALHAYRWVSSCIISQTWPILMRMRSGCGRWTFVGVSTVERGLGYPTDLSRAKLTDLCACVNAADCDHPIRYRLKASDYKSGEKNRYFSYLVWPHPDCIPSKT